MSGTDDAEEERRGREREDEPSSLMFSTSLRKSKRKSCPPPRTSAFDSTEIQSSRINVPPTFSSRNLVLPVAKEKSILFPDDLEKDKDTGEVKGGEMCSIVKLALDQLPSLDLCHYLFLTHRQFCTSDQLLGIFHDLWTASLTYSNQSDKDYTQPRIVRAICLWFKLSVSDFSSTGIAEKLTELCNMIQEKAYLYKVISTTLSLSIDTVIQQASLEEMLYLEDTENNMNSVLHFPCQELAQQLTIYFWEELSKVPMVELLSGNMGTASMSPQLTKIANYFNMLTSWVATEIITAPAKKRTKTLEYFIELCSKLLALNNFHGYFTLALAISQNSLNNNNTRDVWAKLQSKSVRRWEVLQEIMSPMSNFKTLREKIEESKPPVVLPLMLLVKDLTALEVGNKNFLKGGGVNLTKVTLLGDLLFKFKESQQNPYLIEVNPSIQAYLRTLKVLDDETLRHATQSWTTTC